MLTKITGVLNRVLDEEARLQVGPFEYQVLIPEFVRRQIQTHTGESITFHVLEYIEGNQNSNKMVPRKIGFSSEMELDFFELFCTVDKIGVKKALKAMGRPIRELAGAIQRQDVKWLTTMPGIGKTTAEQIVATLKTKVTKYALLGEQTPGDGTPAMPAAAATIFEDSYIALMGLGLSPADARNRLDLVFKGGREFADVGEVISEVFRKKDK
jgi:Holliday junction DNA helicase RuvA